MRYEEFKIFEVDQKYYVLTDTKENAVKIVNDEELYYFEGDGPYFIDDCKECNYSDETMRMK
jgi:hypothetical protein